jgi:hypothetical protein
MILRQGYDHAANGRFVRTPMKIDNFNINNIHRRLTNLLDWIRESDPDIVCLQKLKQGHRVSCGGAPWARARRRRLSFGTASGASRRLARSG